MDKHLHIVCLDVPYPVDYGGVFDIFYKIKALYERGIKIHLHCFEYGRGKQPELNQYCEEVLYYERMHGHKGFSLNIPYIVSSRRCNILLANLLNDDYPILLEGIHCSYHVFNQDLRNRKIFLRLHNVEYEYYYHLYTHERSFFKKAYYYLESKLLRNYEMKIAGKVTILTTAIKDLCTYKKNLGAEKICFLPVFVPFSDIKSKEGLGTFCLYHGNLSVAENEKAAIWLIRNVFNKVQKPFIIAGKNPSARLQRIAKSNTHVHVIANPNEAEMQDLITKAQVNILPSFNQTGIKLKLLNALFNGRHCIVNLPAIEDTGFEQACHIANDATDFQKTVSQLYYKPFSRIDIQLRRQLLTDIFNNQKNAEALITLIW